VVWSVRSGNEVRGQERGEKRGAKYVVVEGIMGIGWTMDVHSVNKSSKIGDIFEHCCEDNSSCARLEDEVCAKNILALSLYILEMIICY
jgi:hypothetical protein